VQWSQERRDEQDARIAACAWDGDWFIWAIDENGKVYGTKDYNEGQIYLNTQVWAVLSGAASSGQAERCMQSVREKLATPFGLMLCAPPFEKTSVEVMRAVVYNPGIKENAGIFNHTQGWGVMAECLLGHGDQAYVYCRAAMPSAYNSRAEIRQSEPYVHAQTTYAPYSPRAGNTRTSWLTGAASWFYFSATQYILGIRPEAVGLRIDPCIPSTWDGFSAQRTWRGCQIQITVHNPGHVCRGVSRMELNGRFIPGNVISREGLALENRVEVWLGA
jgi:N,N'-diacetylchitobiose phosphorylase